MTTPAHSTDHHGGVPAAELDKLIASMTGPVATLGGVVVEAVAGAFKLLLDQAHRAGVEAGLAQAEHAVARAVGTRATVESHGVDGTLIRCGTCGGDGLVVRTEPPAPYRRDPAATTVIPRLENMPPGETTVLPRISDRVADRPNDPTLTRKFDAPGRRD